MSRVIFMCGPAGSGKSTHARRLEEQGMVRLSFDAVLWERGISTASASDEVRAGIETELQTRLLALIGEGRDVVLDFSFWSREMRDRYRRLVAPDGVVPETIHLATVGTTALDRVRARRGSHPDDVALTDEMAAQHFDNFEVPSPAEGPLTVIRT